MTVEIRGTLPGQHTNVFRIEILFYIRENVLEMAEYGAAASVWVTVHVSTDFKQKFQKLLIS